MNRRRSVGDQERREYDLYAFGRTRVSGVQREKRNAGEREIPYGIGGWT
jgi:hypothetical protein